MTTSPFGYPAQDIGRAGSGGGSKGGGRSFGGGGTFGRQPQDDFGTPLQDQRRRDTEIKAADARNTVEATPTGQTLWDVLDMPEMYADGQQQFVMTGELREGAPSGGSGLINYTVAAGVEWFRDLAVNDTQRYNALVADLYRAGYLSESDVRFGAFTGQAAEAFAEAAFDTARVNMGRDAGSIVTLMDNLDSIITGFEMSGFGPNGAGGGGGREAAPPTRVDQWSNPDDLRETLRGAAQNALGRSLTDAEEAAFLASFKSKEKSWNDDRYGAQVDEFNGQATDMVDRPNSAAAASEFMRSNPKMAQEKAGEDMASYVGVMNRMMGLGSEGIGIA